jgi:putative ABC transport system substrate-binding protein
LQRRRPLGRSRRAQTERVRRIGVLMSTRAGDPLGEARLGAFLRGLQPLGWTEGRNVQIEVRWTAGDADAIRKHAAELVALTPDDILASGGSVVGPLLQTTRNVPVVFTQTPYPVAAAFVASLARPGGNATGFTQVEYGTGAKWLELLKEIAPRVTRAAVLRDPAIPEGIGQFAVIQSAAASFRMEVSPVDIRDANEIERAVGEFARSANGGMIVTSSGLAGAHRPVILALAARHRLARGLCQSRVRHRRRTDLLRGGFDRPASSRCRLRRSHPEGREAGQSAGACGGQAGVDRQPHDRQGARHRVSAHHP